MVELVEIGLYEVGLPCVELGGVNMIPEQSHIHDYVGNWLWDDGGCILWDDGLVIAL